MAERVDVEPGSPEWLAARRSGVTATDIVTICGLSATDSAYALYWRKLGVIAEPGDNDRWRLGRDLEPIIFTRWWDEHPGTLAPGAGPQLCRSSERPWQMATLDRALWTDPHELTDEPDAVLELKSWADADRHAWDDGPPPAVRAQVLWQMDTLSVATGHVGVLFLPSGEFRSYVIEHTDVSPDPQDPEYPIVCDHGCEACSATVAMREAGALFMERLIENDPPSPDGSAATLAALKARFPDARNDKAAPVGWSVWDAYSTYLDKAAEYKRLAKEGEALIRELIGEAGVIAVDGEVVARRLRYPVKAHQRKAGVVDKIMRVKRKETEDDDS